MIGTVDSLDQKKSACLIVDTLCFSFAASFANKTCVNYKLLNLFIRWLRTGQCRVQLKCNACINKYTRTKPDMTSPFLCFKFKDLINFACAAYIAGEIVKCIAILAAIPSALSNYLLVTSTANSLAGWNKPFRFFYGGCTL